MGGLVISGVQPDDANPRGAQTSHDIEVEAAQVGGDDSNLPDPCFGHRKELGDVRAAPGDRHPAHALECRGDGGFPPRP